MNKQQSGRPWLTAFQMTLGALYVAMFALAGNVPVLSSIQIIPGVPITLQVFLIAMMGLTLGVRGGLAAYLSVLVLTFCGLPMMAGGKGGPAVFFGPTGGYILGWVFIVLLLGWYSSRYMERLVTRRFKGISIHLPVSFALGMAGVLLDYICGSAMLAVVSGQPAAAFPGLLLSNLAFLPGDAVKIGLASLLSLALFVKPVFVRLFRTQGIHPHI